MIKIRDTEIRETATPDPMRPTDYTLPVHSEVRQLPGIMLEFRKDKLQDQDAVKRWNELFGQYWLSKA